MSKGICVLIVDDSALIRCVLTEILRGAPGIGDVFTAQNAEQAREMIRKHSPDVLTLDIEMPGMSGLEFLKQLMQTRPMPVIMVSSATSKGAETTLRALDLGAVDYLAKPTINIESSMREYGDDLVAKITAAASSNVKAVQKSINQFFAAPRMAHQAGAVIAIGASTGGVDALQEVIVPFPAGCPPVLVAQHMPAKFTELFAERLNSLCKVKVKEAEHGELLASGTVYVAPGNYHMRLSNGAGGLCVELDQLEPVNRHRPSVDVLFGSVARIAGLRAVGVLLTGMGGDGARGLLQMRLAGAWTIAQDEASCVVFGMPREAIAMGAAKDVIPLNDIAPRLLSYFSERNRSLLQS